MTIPLSNVLTSYRTRKQARIDREVERMLGWAKAPVRTIRQIAADIEPWPTKAKDTLPPPRWSLSFMDKVYATVLFMELILAQRRQLR